jgi:hypothetical protein
MSLLRPILLALSTALSFSALASTPALAACSDGGTRSVFCFQNNNEIRSEEALGTSGVSKLEAKIGGAALRIECANGKGSGLLEALGAGKGLSELSTCSVTEPANCTVSQPILVKGVGQLSTGMMPATGLVTGAAGAEEFTTLTVAGTGCSVPGSYQVTGLQTVELPKGEESLVEHEVVAKKAGSKLKLGVESASFSSTAKVHLASGLAFLVMLGS